MNYRLLLQYDGTDFHGWQVQDGLRTVQGELTRVLSMLEGADVHVSGSGRTDAGVHAEGQVASVKLTKNWDLEKLRHAINGNLWYDLRVFAVDKMPDDFHARFSAKSKTYLYRIINAPIISPFWCRYAHLETRPLDVARMNEVGRHFLGMHDWTAFSAAQSDAESRVRTISNLLVESRWDSRANASLIDLRISADGFLRYMVRSIVGTLLEVGRGDKKAEIVQEAIVTLDRKLSGPTAPANGLTLLEVRYD
jgi:tRNA pseudouridine38-40 synthase